MGNRLAAVLCIVAPSVVAACQAQDVPTDLPNVPVDAVAVQFQTIERITSPIGGPPEAERRVIRDDASWLAFWRQLTGAIVPPPEPPAIDFSSEMVLVAAMGRRPTGGYAITIEGVYEQTGTLYVDVLAQSPAASCMVIQMLTAPVTAVRLTQHTGDVRFLDRSESTGCG